MNFKYSNDINIINILLKENEAFVDASFVTLL